jgi:hypothetical protein
MFTCINMMLVTAMAAIDEHGDRKLGKYVSLPLHLLCLPGENPCNRYQHNAACISAAVNEMDCVLSSGL